MPRNMPDNEEDFIRMQQEAIRRVRDMQSRARRTLEDAGMNIASPYPEAPAPAPAPPTVADPDLHRENEINPQPFAAPTSQPEPPRGRSAGLSGLPAIFNLSLDSEQILLMVLIYMLYREGTDNFLLLAMAYILLP